MSTPIDVGQLVYGTKIRPEASLVSPAVHQELSTVPDKPGVSFQSPEHRFSPLVNVSTAPGTGLPV